MKHVIIILAIMILLLPANPLYASLGEPVPVEKKNPELISRVKNMFKENGYDSTAVQISIEKLSPGQLALIEETLQSEAGGAQSTARTFSILVIVLSVVCLFFVIWMLSIIF